jgi:hypothetical protein
MMNLVAKMMAMDIEWVMHPEGDEDIFIIMRPNGHNGISN